MGGVPWRAWGAACGVCAVCSFLLGSVATSARADDKTEARVLVQKAVQRFKAGQYSEALELFARADTKFHSPAITYNIAQAREKLGQAQAALDAYSAYLTEAGTSGKYAEAAKVAIDEIRERSSEVEVVSQPPGATIVIDGVDVSASTPRSIVLFPGSHSIEVQLDDWRQTKQLEVPAAGQRLKLRFGREPAAASAPEARAEPNRGPTASPGPGKPDGLVFGGGLAFIPFTFVGATQSRSYGGGGAIVKDPSQPKGLLFGGSLEIGLTPTPGDLVFLVRGLGGFGFGPSDAPGGDDMGFAVFGGPGFAYRVSPRLQIGAALAFGVAKFNGESDGEYKSCATCNLEPLAASDETEFSYGLLGDISYTFLPTPHGEWFASLGLVALKAGDQNVDGLIAAPVAFGYRVY